MGQWGEDLFDAKVVTDFSEMCIIKLGAMIGHKLTRYSKSADDVIPDEVSHVLLRNFF